MASKISRARVYYNPPFRNSGSATGTNRAESHLCDLALLYTHRDMTINVDSVLRQFHALRHRRILVVLLLYMCTECMFYNFQ